MVLEYVLLGLLLVVAAICGSIVTIKILDLLNIWTQKLREEKESIALRNQELREKNNK